jgi:putative flippase GtrA
VARAALAAEARRFLRFVVVGAAGFLIDAGLLALLHNWGGFDPFSARAVSILAAAFTTWRLNRRLTFVASDTSQTTEALRYGTIAALTAGLNYMLYALLLLLWPELPPLMAVVIATLLAMGCSYVGYSRFVFQGSREAIGGPSSQSR